MKDSKLIAATKMAVTDFFTEMGFGTQDIEAVTILILAGVAKSLKATTKDLDIRAYADYIAGGIIIATEYDEDREEEDNEDKMD